MIDACCHGSLTAASSYGRRVEMDGWRNSLVGGTAAMPVRAGKHMDANVTIWRQHLCVWSQIVWPWRRFCIAMVTWCLYYADSIVCLTIRRAMFTAFSAYRHFVCWYFTDKNLFNCFTYLCHIERIIWIYYTGRWYRVIKRFVDYHKENWLVRVGHVASCHFAWLINVQLRDVFGTKCSWYLLKIIQINRRILKTRPIKQCDLLLGQPCIMVLCCGSRGVYCWSVSCDGCRHRFVVLCPFRGHISKTK